MTTYKRLNITLPDEVLARADEFARRERYTRSGLIAAAVDAFVSAGPPTEGESVAEARAAYGAVCDRVVDLSLERVGALLHAFLSARDEVEAAWVFGSVARDEATAMSDVDVAVLPAGEMDADSRFRLRVDLMSRLPGVLGADTVDVAVWPEMGSLLGHRALVDGVRVYGEWSRAAAEAEIRAANAYWDFAPVRGMLAERLSERVGLDGPR